MAPSIAPKYIDREDLERITGQKFEDYASATDSEAEDMATEKYVDDKLRERRESREQESSAGGGKRIADDEENNESPSKNVSHQCCAKVCRRRADRNGEGLI